MLAIRSLSRSQTTVAARRGLVTSAQKRALNKSQLEGGAKSSTAAVQGGGDAIKPASVPSTPSGGGGGGGGGAIVALLLGAGGVGAAYYNDLIPSEYLPGFMKADKAKPAEPTKKEKNISHELKQAVKEVKALQAAEAKKEQPEESKPEEPEQPPVPEHPEDGNRVTNEMINTFYAKVNEGKAKEEEEQLEKAQESAVKATEYNEGETVTVVEEVDVSLPSSASAISELQSKARAETSSALATAQANLRTDLDQTFLSDLDSLSPSQLRIRIVQLVAEMTDRTKWEAIRIQEFLSLKEKEVGEKYLEILQKQRLEYEDLLARRIREAEDSITRQANEALRAKDESMQNLLAAMRDGREKEMQDSVQAEVDKIRGDLELEYQKRLQNALAEMKHAHVSELNKYTDSLSKMQAKMSDLETRLQISRQYESGSKRAHAVSAAALALTNKLENGEPVEVEVAALKGATAGEEEGVIASAVKMIPREVGSGKRVLSLGELQTAFDESYKKGRQAAMVPEGRSGLEGQLLGMLFANLSVPPSPDATNADETDPAILTDSILSTARKYVHSGDIEKAVEQLDRLRGQTAYVMSDWKKNAMDRVATERALKVIKLECALLNKDLVGTSL
eukprot:CCRYP_002247-RB/>CCRYP_002247-RB protein AED:0.19 eAED:0.19 QI:94/1/1/1/0.5/0.33/3/245/620